MHQERGIIGQASHNAAKARKLMNTADLITIIGSLIITSVSVSWYLGTKIKAPLDLMNHKLSQITKENAEIWEELKAARADRTDIWKDRAKLSERIIAIEAKGGTN